MSAEKRKRIRDFFRGLRNAHSLQQQAGTRRLETGQDSLPYEDYVWLMNYFLRKGDLFAFAFGLLAWNTLCRRANVAAVHLQHLVLSNDKVDLFTPRTKVDHVGARAKTPIGIFSNPTDVAQCCVTGIALMLAAQEGGRRPEDGGLLFQGSRQAQRFAACMQAAFESADGQARLAGRGGGHELRYAPHSLRKGAKNFLEQSKAPHVAKMSRGGWSTGAVAQRYDRATTDSDAECGRIAAGLRKRSYEEFALLPPHFPPEAVSDAEVMRCFPAFVGRSGFVAVLRFLLGPLVHHLPALAEALPATSRLRMHPLFASRDFAERLRAKLITGLDSPFMRATGIPDDLIARREASRQMRDLFDQRLPAAAAGQDAPPPPPLLLEDSASASAPAGFSPAFEFPKDVTPLKGFRLLVRGCPERNEPPYRLLETSQFPSERRTKLKKEISTWRYLFNAIADRCPALRDGETLERLRTDDDETELLTFFYEAWDSFCFPTAKIGVRREWTLETAVRKIRHALAAQPKKRHAPPPRAAPRVARSGPKNASVLFRSRRQAPLATRVLEEEDPVVLPSVESDDEDDADGLMDAMMTQFKPLKRPALSTSDAEDEEENSPPVKKRRPLPPPPVRPVPVDYAQFFQ